MTFPLRLSAMSLLSPFPLNQFPLIAIDRQSVYTDAYGGSPSDAQHLSYWPCRSSLRFQFDPMRFFVQTIGSNSADEISPATDAGLVPAIIFFGLLLIVASTIGAIRNQRRNRIFVRPATDQELGKVRGLIDSAFAGLRQVYEPTPEAFAREASKMTEQNYLVAVSQRSIVGALSYSLMPDGIHVTQWATDSRFKQRGIARRLISHLKEIAVQMRQPSISLCTVEETGNVSIFERLGFEIVAREVSALFRTPAGQHVHEVRMKMPVFHKAGRE